MTASIQAAETPNMLNIAPISALTGPLVVALVYDGLCMFEFAIVTEVFGLPRPELGEGWYRFAACAVESGPLHTQDGIGLEIANGPEVLASADLIVVPGWRGADAPVPQPLIDVLIAAHARGARLASICSGAFVLAATGLLDERRAATHWRYAEALQRAYPRLTVDSRVLYVEDGCIFTSAGSAAGIDLMLHIVRSDFGAAVANSVARRLVVPPHRSGGQAQFVESPVAPRSEGPIAPLLDSLRAAPARRWTVAEMAHEVAMTERTFLRRFGAATGHSPGEWLTAMRVDEAKKLLEATALPVEEVARLAGFGSTATLRHHFGPRVGLAPREYRDRFRNPPHASRMSGDP